MAKKKPTPAAPKKPTPTAKVAMDHDFVRDLALILRETELSEIEVERDGLKVRVARQMTVTAQPVYAPAPLPVSTPIAAHTPLPAAATPAERIAHPGAVKSPMVGTAYQAPQPGAPAFVKIGDQVKEGQTLLIIEAMKTMNQIPSPRTGKVIEILIKDGQPVEYGEVLMIVE